MKRILIAITMLILVLPAIERAGAAEVSVDFFYDNLTDGNWIEVGDYGYGFQPNAASDPRWRPYTDGYWAYTDVGWTWVSYEESFGWATYHYGRWADIEGQGWVWFPGNDLEWGPAWVTWRTGGDYVGWAPLPPRGGDYVYEGQPITGHVDVEFDIGPAYYNFVDVRYIGEPVVREHIFASSQNVTYINKTVNVTNITYKNSTVYNYGPDYETVNRYSTRPIPRLSLQHETNVDASATLKSGGHTKVQGNMLVISAPMKIQRSAQPSAPKNVKVKVAQAKIEHGWRGLSDPKAQADLKQKMQTEDANNVAPPSVQPRAGAGANASAGGSVAPTTSVAPVVASSPAVSSFEKGKNRTTMPAQQNVGSSPSASVAGSPMERGGKGLKNKRGEQNAPAGMPTASPSASATLESAVPMERSKGPKNKHGEQNAPGGMPNASPSGSVTSESTAPMQHGPKAKHADSNVSSGSTNTMAPTGGASIPPEGNMETTTKGKHKADRSDLTGPPPVSAGAPGATNAAPQEHKAKLLPAESAGQGEKAKGKKKGEESPTPGPQ